MVAPTGMLAILSAVAQGPGPVTPTAGTCPLGRWPGAVSTCHVGGGGFRMSVVGVARAEHGRAEPTPCPHTRFPASRLQTRARREATPLQIGATCGPGAKGRSRGGAFTLGGNAAVPDVRLACPGCPGWFWAGMQHLATGPPADSMCNTSNGQMPWWSAAKSSEMFSWWQCTFRAWEGT